MQYCYSCMSEINTEGKCPHCGFDQKNYQVEPHQLPPGYILKNRFVIGKVLGEGGFGITYIGLDKSLGVKVAIKEFYMSGFVNRNNTFSAKISAETGSKGEFFNKNKARFYDEAKTLAKFNSIKGIVSIKEFFYENETAYIIMDYIEGKTLSHYLKINRKFSVKKTIDIIYPILGALEAIHKENIIHRDISPENIMISKDGKVYLIDFGAARAFSEDEVKSLSVILKPGYAPEEQYRTKGIQGPWTDIYSLSATMYRCISGKRPEEVLERLTDDRLPELYKVSSDCSKALSDIVMKGLAVKYQNRYQNATLMKNDIQRVINIEFAKPALPKQPQSQLQTAAQINSIPQIKSTVSEKHVPLQSSAAMDKKEKGPSRAALESKSSVVQSATTAHTHQNGSSGQVSSNSGKRLRRKKTWLIPVIAGGVSVIGILIVSIVVIGLFVIVFVGGATDSKKSIQETNDNSNNEIIDDGSDYYDYGYSENTAYDSNNNEDVVVTVPLKEVQAKVISPNGFNQVNVHTKPDSSSTVTATVGVGKYLTINGIAYGSDGKQWYSIITPLGAEGYLREDCLDIRE